jgi:ribonuclease HI
MIECYTDASYNPKFDIGTWAAIIFIQNKKQIINKIEKSTNHNRLELTAVIETIKHLTGFNEEIIIYTDSQYVAELKNRSEKLVRKKFKTSKGDLIRNFDLVRELLLLLSSTEVSIIKVKAHGKKDESENYNREVDILARKMLRDYLKTYYA